MNYNVKKRSLGHIFSPLLVLFCLIGVLGIVSGCKPKKGDTDSTIETTNEDDAPNIVTESEEDANWNKALKDVKDEDTLALDTKLLNLKRDVSYHWNRLMAGEAEKDEMIQKLIRESSFIEGFKGKVLMEQLDKKRQELLTHRYDSLSMQNPNAMDVYDQNIAEIQKLITQIKEENPELERYSAPKTILAYFANLENSDFQLRSNYANKAEELNHILNTQKDEIKKLGDTFINIKPAPVFKYNE